MILQTLFDRFAFAGLLSALGFDAFKQCCELGQRVVSANLSLKLTLVVDQFACDFEFLLTDPIQRLNLAGVDYSRVQPGLDGIV